MPLRRRILLSLVFGLLAAALCGLRLTQRGQLGADFTWPWRAARLLWAGQNPYEQIRPTGEYPFQTYFYYPLPAALAALPFAPLPPTTAAAVFFGLSSGLMAFALTQEGWQRLTIFLSAPFWVALAVAQWSPLLLAATLLPGLQALLICKPNIGLAGFLYNPTRVGLLGMGLLLALSLLVFPGWPLSWLSVSHGLEGHPPPLLVLPFGPLLLLALLRWRKPEARLLLGLSIFPQLLFFYDQLALGLIPSRLSHRLLFAGLSWLAYLGWRLTGVNPTSGEILIQPTQWILGLIYLPALALLIWYKAPAHKA